MPFLVCSGSSSVTAVSTAKSNAKILPMIDHLPNDNSQKSATVVKKKLQKTAKQFGNKQFKIRL